MRRRSLLLSVLQIPLLSLVAAASPEGDAAIRPTETLRLFDGKTLDAFYAWLVDTHREDPRRVFTVVDQRTRSTLTKGKILIQSEGAEIYVRRVDLEPLK